MSEADLRSAPAPVNVLCSGLSEWQIAWEPDWRLGDAEFKRLKREIAKLERVVLRSTRQHPSRARLIALRAALYAYQPPDRTCCRPKGKHSPDPGGAPGGGDCQGDDPKMDHLPHEDGDR